MKKTKFIGVILLLLFMGACSNEDSTTSNVNKKEETVDAFKYTNYLDGVNLSNNEQIGLSADYAIDVTNVPTLRDNMSNVFIGTVDSIDGCSPTAENGTFNPMPYTYGKITVLDNLVGETNAPTIKFVRGGGTISIADYEKDAPAEMINRDNIHRKEAGQENIDKENTYLTFFFNDDITIEAGKTYLFFTIYVSETDSYLISSAQYGTREIYQPASKATVFRSMPDESTLTLKNNETGTYEDLDAFLDTYFRE